MKEYNDYELLTYIKEHNDEATKILYDKYKPLINQNATRLIKYSKYSGLDKSDLIQEGMLGLTNAINTFNDSKETSFYTYAKACIERKQISLVIGSQRVKHKTLNEAISIETSNDDDTLSLKDTIGDNKNNPEAILTDLENSEYIKNEIRNKLTKLEKHVFDLKIRGYNYVEIAGILDISKKQVDNATSRIKAKLKDLIDK